MHEKKGCKLIVDVSSEGIPQYTLDGGVSWTRYSGTWLSREPQILPPSP